MLPNTVLNGKLVHFAIRVLTQGSYSEADYGSKFKRLRKETKACSLFCQNI